MVRRLTAKNAKLQNTLNAEFWNRVKYVQNGVARRFPGQEGLFAQIDKESSEAIEVPGGGSALGSGGKDKDEVLKHPKSGGDRDGNGDDAT